MAKPVNVVIVEKALELISDPRRWTIGTVARKADGSSTRYSDKEAVSFCAVGAIWRSAIDVLGKEKVHAATKAAPDDPTYRILRGIENDMTPTGGYITSVNDSGRYNNRHHDDPFRRAERYPKVIAMFKKYLEKIHA